MRWGGVREEELHKRIINTLFLPALLPRGTALPVSISLALCLILYGREGGGYMTAFLSPWGLPVPGYMIFLILYWSDLCGKVSEGHLFYGSQRQGLVALPLAS